MHERPRIEPSVAASIFNTAYTTTSPVPGGNTDVDLALSTTCNRRVDQVPNGAGGYVDGVCDPTGGYSFTRNTLDNFGKTTSSAATG